MAQFSVKITTKVSLWDIVSGRVKGKSKHATEVNSILDKMAVSISTTYRKQQESRTSIKATNLKNTFQSIASEQETLIKSFTHHNEESKKRVGVNRKLSTYQNNMKSPCNTSNGLWH